MSQPSRENITATSLGIVAILIWASLVAVARGTQEHAGVVASGALANAVGGLAGLAVAGLQTGYFERLRCLPLRYLVGCGGLFVAYNLCLFPALNMAKGELQVVQVGLIQYLWPALTLAFSVPVLGKRPTIWLWPGLVTATCGVFLSKSGALTWKGLGSGFDASPWPYALALGAAVSWGLYSNLARRWAGQSDTNAAPLFLLVTGLLLGAVHLLGGGDFEVSRRPGPLLELAYLALFPTLLAYVFWDTAMRRGNIILVTSLSFLTPLLSTLITCSYLGVPMSSSLWAASLLVVVGAAVCKMSIRDSEQPGAEAGARP